MNRMTQDKQNDSTSMITSVTSTTAIDVGLIYKSVVKMMLSVCGMGLLVLTSGCATTKLTPQQCAVQNWQAVGQADGENGRSGNYFGKYLAECAGTTTNQPNRKQWEAGRQQGLVSYCTELNAYKLGREGYGWQAVCPLDNIEKLENAYREGRLNYLREQQLDSWNDWYYDHPWRHRHRHGWGRFYW